MGHDTEFERAVYHYCWHFTAKTSDYLNEQVCWSSRFSFMPLSFTLKIQRRPDQAPFYTSAHPHHSPVCTRVSNLYYVIIQVIISSLREIRWQLFGSGSARCCVGQYRTVPHITCRYKSGLQDRLIHDLFYLFAFYWTLLSSSRQLTKVFTARNC